MTLAVLAFQLLIVFTMIVARLAFRETLFRLAMIWTAFTGVAVFASWLAALQLVTIWLSYSLLKPNNDDRALIVPADAVERPISPRPHAQELVDPTARATQSNTQARPLSALDRLSASIDTKMLVATAVRELEIAVHGERAVVSAALDSARRELEIEVKKRADPQFAVHYDREFERISKLLDDASEPKVVSEEFAAPDFDVPVNVSDPEAKSQIKARVAQIRGERSTFLNECLSELRADPELKRLFWRNLNRDGQHQIATAFVEYAKTSATATAGF